MTRLQIEEFGRRPEFIEAKADSESHPGAASELECRGPGGVEKLAEALSPGGPIAQLARARP